MNFRTVERSSSVLTYAPRVAATPTVLMGILLSSQNVGAEIWTRTEDTVSMRPCYASQETANGICEFVEPHQVEFQSLIERWHNERGSASSINEIAMCPAYQRIIAMGEIALPMILRQLESEHDEPDMWFWALRVLSNADPVSNADRGDIVAMRNAWLNWGRSRYAW